jgi:hypothetical protein
VFAVIKKQYFKSILKITSERTLERTRIIIRNILARPQSSAHRAAGL